MRQGRSPSRWAPRVALLFLSPFIGEVLSSNTPASAFVRQASAIPFALVTYSVPVLLVRELRVARGLSPAALLLCGVAYGIFNEGLLARTLLMDEGLPIATFDGYFMLLGVNVAWALALLVWHALFSVATPILLVDWLWPEQSRTRWLSGPSTVVALAVTLSTSLLFFRAAGAPPPPGAYFAAFALAITGLVAVAARGTGRATSALAFSWRPLLAGVASFAYFGGLFLGSALRVHPALYVGGALATLAVLAAYALRPPNAEGRLLLFCLGSSASYLLFAFAAKLRGSPEGVVVALSIGCGYAVLLRRALRPGSRF